MGVKTASERIVIASRNHGKYIIRVLEDGKEEVVDKIDMIDTETIYFQTDRELAKSFGKTVSDETLWKMMGRKPTESYTIFREALEIVKFVFCDIIVSMVKYIDKVCNIILK